MDATQRTAAIKTITEVKDATGKPAGFTDEEIKGLGMNSDKEVARLATLAAKSPADSIIQAKAAADAALAGHAHGLKAMDDAKAAKDKEAADAKAKAEEDAKDGGADDDKEDAAGKKVKAAMKAAAAAGISVEEYEEREFLKTAPASIRAMAAKYKAAEAARKAVLITALKGGPLTDKQLEAKPLEELETLAAFAGVKEETVDFSGRGMPRAAEAGRDDVAPDPYSKANIDKHFGKTAVN